MDFITDTAYSDDIGSDFKKKEYVYLSLISSLEFELDRLKKTFSGLSLESVDYISNSGADTIISLDGIPVHPLVKLELERLHREVQEKDILLETATKEMNVASFDTQSLIGQRLVMKCKVLQEENKYLGKKVLSLKTSQCNMSNFQYQDFLEGEIKKLHSIIEDLEIENQRLTNSLKSASTTNDSSKSNEASSHDRHESKHDRDEKYDKIDRYERRRSRSKSRSRRDKSHSSRHRTESHSRRSASRSPYKSRSHRSPYSPHSRSSRHRHHN